MKEKKKAKIRIGLFVHTLIDKYQKKIFDGVIEIAEKNNADIIIFSGGFLEYRKYYNYQKNAIFDFAISKGIDGIIAISGCLSNKISFNELNSFLKRFNKIPIVSIGSKFDDIPSVTINNELGMKKVVEHLITEHGYKKIVFINGPSGNCEAKLRLSAYKNILKKYNIPINNNLIIEGDFLIDSGKNAVRKLFKNKRFMCDAIIGCNDFMAIDAMNELEKYKIKIPEDIAVAGFDNMEESDFTIPGLTTVNQSPYLLGKIACNKIFSILQGEEYEFTQEIDPEFVIRESCGCLKRFEIRDNKYECKDNTSIFENKDSIKKTLYKTAQNLISNFTGCKIKKSELNKWSVEIIDCLFDVLNNDNIKSLMKIINKILIHSKHHKIDVLHWNSYFMELLDYLCNNSSEKEEKYILKLQLVIKDYIFKHSINQANEARDKYGALNWKLKEYINGIMGVFTFEEMEKMMVSEIDRIQIPAVYLSLFTDSEYSLLRMVVFCKDGEIIKSKYKTKEFPKNKLFSIIIDQQNKSNIYFASSIFCKENRLGAVIFKIDHDIFEIYEDLVLQLSALVQQILLFEEINTHTINLEEKVKQRTQELENAKNKIEKTNEELKVLDELKNDFIANITHDFRTPLTVILSISELVLKFHNNLDEELKSNFDVIYKASIKLKDSIDRLLELAKIDAKGIKLKVKKIEIKKMVQNIINFYISSLVNTNIKIIKKLPENEISDFYTDNEKFEQIINNLMSNAVKFVDKEKGEITIELKERKDTVLVMIKDNGIGIEKDKLKIIFNRFEQIKMRKNSWQRGTGIGLAFSKQLVELLKGKIWADSDGLNKGASFFIELKKSKDVFDNEDIITDRSDTGLKTKNYMRELILSEIEQDLEKNNIVKIFKELNYKNEFDYAKGVILIIDDEKYIRDIIMKYLINAGYKNFIITSNGIDGLNSIYDYNPDLIICDYSMENMKGDELHDEVLNNPRLKNIPFIFLSAVADENVVSVRQKKGATAFLKKPINEDKFLSTINNSMKNYMEYLKTKKMSYIDELTGLNNKKSLLKNLSRELALRRPQDIAVIKIDIDNFKKINNIYSHKVGDRIIEIIGNVISSSVREYDIASRFDSDEFVVVLPDTNIIQAEKVAKGLKLKIEKRNFNFDDKIIKITLSIGISSLLKGKDYICRSLNINNLKDIFNIKKHQVNNWDEISEYKNQISHLLLKMADVSLHNAKCTICSDCGYLTENNIDLKYKKCPKCGSENIIFGRNKIVIL